MYTLPLSIFNIVHLHDVTTSQGESIYLIKTHTHTPTHTHTHTPPPPTHTHKHPHTQLTPCVLDAELDCFEDFNPKKKDFEPIKMNHF